MATKLVWGEFLGPEECPYMRRWFLQTPLGTVRLHHFWRGDDDRALHDHPWGFVTFVLAGGYTDVTPTGREVLRPGSVRYRPAHHLHRVEADGPAWTFVVSGPKRRSWGFVDHDGWMHWSKWLGRYGMPACADTAPRRREPSS